jgi:hypothetical protein
MIMDYREYIAESSYNNDEILGDWQWLLEDKYSIWAITKFGDAFLMHNRDDSIHWLDTGDGRVEKIANSVEDFEEQCQEPDNFDNWFMREVVDGQEALQMRMGTNQCLNFIKPPILGGELHPDNLEVCDIAVHFSIAGQIHNQVKDLPPGTRIDKIKIKGLGKGVFRRIFEKLFKNRSSGRA